MLFNPIFADYLQAYGQGGLKALKLDSLPFLARLYWYTVEFGLVRTPAGLRIYGSGIVSSKGESIYALESEKPKRLPFDLMERDGIGPNEVRAAINQVLERYEALADRSADARNRIPPTCV